MPINITQEKTKKNRSSLLPLLAIQPRNHMGKNIITVWKKQQQSSSDVDFNSVLLTWFWLIILENPGCCGGIAWKRRSHTESEDAPLMKPTIVVVQVAGVKAFINWLQVRDVQ